MTPTPYIPDRRRRRLVASGGALAALVAMPALAQILGLRQTPRTTEGPFYPDVLPVDRDADLARVAGRPGTAAGRLLYLSGLVLDARGKPIAGASIELWQANTYGRYIHSADTDASRPLDPNFQGYGALVTDAEGRYRIRTVLPGSYPGRTRHVHFKFAPGPERRPELTTQMFFEGERGNDDDGVYLALARDERRAATGHYIAPARDSEPGSLAVSWDVVLRA